MKKIKIKKRNMIIISGTILVTMIIGLYTTAFGMQHYYKVDFQTGLVTATTLNVRSGPGTIYGIIATVKQNEYIRIFAGVGEWYVVQIEGDYIGAVSKKYVKPIYPSSNNTGNTGSSGNTGGSSSNTIKVNTKITKKGKMFFTILGNINYVDTLLIFSI